MDENPLDVAVAELAAVADGVDIGLTIESDVLMAGYMCVAHLQRRGPPLRALRAARVAAGAEPGLYSMGDVLGLG